MQRNKRTNATAGQSSLSIRGRLIAVVVPAVIVIAIGALFWTLTPTREPTVGAASESESTGWSDESASAGSANDAKTSSEQSPSSSGENGSWQFPAQYDRFGISRGSEDAPVVVREFADYQCPACGDFYSTVQRLIEDYVESGEVRYVFFDFPLRNVHEHAVVAAQAARCAGRQGHYWPMHDLLYERQSDWANTADPVARFRAYAKEVGIDAQAVATCIDDGETRKAVNQSQRLGQELGVQQTPSVIVGDKAFKGAILYDRLRRAIDERLTDRDGT